MKDPSLHEPSKKVLQMKTWACQACFPRWKPTEGPKHNKPTHHQSKPKPMQEGPHCHGSALSLLLNIVYENVFLTHSHLGGGGPLS